MFRLAPYLFLLLGIVHAPVVWSEAPVRPNFIFFITDDISWNDLGCYGNSVVKTPHLDQLAREGLVFDNAYLTISSCSPSRCSIITGRYPHNTGACELHTNLPTDQYVFPQTLKEAGYYTVLSGKNHMGDVSRAFTKISKGKGPGREEDWVQILRDRPKDRPFFCWLASTDAHRAWQFTDQAPRYDPNTVKVPPFLYDGPVTRQDLADYYHEVSRTDTFLGQLRKELERQGVAQDTYVVYCSDNGRPFPRCKTRLYDSGIKTPLIVWRPDAVKPARTTALVSTIDLAPTFLELAGLNRDPRIQGVSLTPLLNQPSATVRDYVFGEHNWHVFQAHERMVRYGDWVYIRNAWPERQNLCVESTAHFPAGTELWQAEASGKLKPHQRDIFLKPRPAEELYDLSKDPDQLQNRRDDPSARLHLVHLREVLDRWSDQTGDTVPLDPKNDREDLQRRKNSQHRPGTMPGSERQAPACLHPGPIRRSGVAMGNGFKIGAVTQDSAIVWVRLTQESERLAQGIPFPDSGKDHDPNAQMPSGLTLNQMEGAVPGIPGEVRLTYGAPQADVAPRTLGWTAVESHRDFTHQFQLERLKGGIEYQVQVEGRPLGGQTVTCTQTGRFRTPAGSEIAKDVSFCVVTGQDYHRRDDPQKGHRIYKHMLNLDPDFFVNTGDTIYYDKAKPYAGTIPLARFKWNRFYGLPYQRHFHRQVGSYFIKDDHDTLKNDCWPDQRYWELTWQQGLDLFQEQVPVGKPPYYTVRWGKHLQIWVVEGREYRSANNLPDGPEKTIWGTKQKHWFFDTVQDSDATFRVLVSATPVVGPDRSNKNDNHANRGFTHEGRELRRFMADQKNMVSVCGDRHWQYVSVDPETGLKEFSCGPTTDVHAGGFRQSDRSDMHRYLNICGGFLNVGVERAKKNPRLVLRHYDTNGKVLNKEVIKPKD